VLMSIWTMSMSAGERIGISVPVAADSRRDG